MKTLMYAGTMLDMSTPDPEWRQYERQIEDQLREIAPDAKITFDARLGGRFSGTDRQVDVLVEGEFKGYGRARMAVDCKFFSTNVTVTGADTFVGYVDDLGVDLGLLVTTKGFSKSAERRLKSARGLRFQIIPFEKISDWEPPTEFCTVCAEARGPDAPPGVVFLEPIAPETFRDDPLSAVGICDRCDAVHVECACGTVTPVHEAEEGQSRECEGGCGTTFRVAPVELDRDQVPVSLDPLERLSVE